MVTIVTRVSTDIHNQIIKVMDKEGIESKSEFLNNAIVEYISNHTENEEVKDKVIKRKFFGIF